MLIFRSRRENDVTEELREELLEDDDVHEQMWDEANNTDTKDHYESDENEADENEADDDLEMHPVHQAEPGEAHRRLEARVQELSEVVRALQIETRPKRRQRCCRRVHNRTAAPCCQADERCVMCSWPSFYLIVFYWSEVLIWVTRGSTGLPEDFDVHKISQLLAALTELGIGFVLLVLSAFSTDFARLDGVSAAAFLAPYLGVLATNCWIAIHHTNAVFQMCLDLVRYAFIFLVWLAPQLNAAAALVSAAIHVLLLLEAADVNLTHGHDSLRKLRALIEVVLLFFLLQHAVRFFFSTPSTARRIGCEGEENQPQLSEPDNLV
ncbi:hypothetical protein CTAYLR_010784 [Chrysophaeum taylorii]|uniref:Uncharacterized protein n=1 Tax=Chrysophaeum taylorii TaxID=2483200 RepID=A0AAD7UJL4_9STRA|nr:hypothetical protein CTAYLR_010784 [Chrysophaeum taylorii]